MNMELLLNSNPSGLYFDKVFENISELSDEDNINAVLPGRLVFCKENSAIYRRIKLNNDNSYELLSYFGGSSDESIPGLPKVTTDDNGKILRVVSGIWNKDNLPSDLPNIEGSEDERKVLGIINGEWDKISLGNFAIVINITKKGNGGAPDTVSQKIANANTGYKLTSSDIPFLTDTTTQIFDGWHYNTSEGNRANVNDVIFTDIVLVQKWINKKHFTIIYNDNNESQETIFNEKTVHKYIDPSLSTYTITQNDLNFSNTGKTSPVTINKSTYNYKYTFNNWYNQTLGTISTSTKLLNIENNQEFKFYADWTKNKIFYISYNIPYGGQSITRKEVEIDYDDVNYTLTNNDLPNFSNYIPTTGDKWYQPNGWKDSNNNIVTNGSSIVAANITLQANQIEKAIYTIKYNTNGKGTTPSSHRYTSNTDYNTNSYIYSFNLSNLPTRPNGVSDDWVFDGWSYNGNTYINGSGSIQIAFDNTKEVTFTASWSANNNKVCYYGALSAKAAPTATELNNLSSILLTNGNNDFTVPISSNNSQYVFFMYPASLTGITQYFYDGTGYQSGGFSNELEQATYNNIIYNLYITRQTQSGSVKIRLKKGEE